MTKTYYRNWMRAKRAKLYAQGLTAKGTPRARMKHDDLKHLKGKAYRAAYMRKWRRD